MALLTSAGIQLLGRLHDHWTDAEQLEIDASRDRAVPELVREGLAETRVWPPPEPGRRVSWRASTDRTVYRTQLRITGRGVVVRLQRLRAGRRT